MAVNNFINFDGNCREAATFYAEVFGLEKPVFMTFGDAAAQGGEEDPDHPISEEMKDLILYSCLNIHDSLVMFSDAYPGMELKVGNNISLTISTKDMNEVETLFNKLKVGGTVGMELQKMFWSDLYGSLVDKFGIPWQISHDSGRY